MGSDRTPSARLAQQTWRWEGGEIEPVLTWLRGFGMTVRPLGPGDYAIDGLSGVTVGLSSPPSDPLAVAIPLGYAFFGMWWPQAVPALLDLVKQEWAQRRKRRRDDR
jgi:hypothetical protein